MTEEHLETDIEELFKYQTFIPVFKTLANNPDEEYNKTELAEASDIGRDSLYNFWNILERQSIVQPSQKGRYTLNTKNAFVNLMWTALYSKPPKWDLELALSVEGEEILA